MTYKPLPPTFRKHGYEYVQAWRDEDYAIYSQASGSKFVAYEVYRITKNDPGERFGKVFEATESIPSSEQWGRTAYTVATIAEAHDKIGIIEASRREPQEPKNTPLP